MSQTSISAVRVATLAHARGLQLLYSGSARAFSATGAASSAQAEGASSGYSGPPKVVVFGGRGFVGSAVCEEAVNSGLSVVSVSRAGTPPLAKGRWVEGVSWVRGDALEPRTFASHLEGASAVISCIGAFGSQEEMLKLNGAANIAAMEAAKAAGVQRFVYISAHIPNIPGIDSLLGGYIRGKAAAEDALRANFPTTGVALRPGAIYGDRIISNSITLPLGLAFKPVEMLLERLGPATTRQMAGVPFLGAAFVPPVSVKVVARSAVRAASDPSVPGGVIDVWQLAAEK